MLSREEAVRLAELTLDRCGQIARCSEMSGGIQRTFLSPPMHGCHAAFEDWMKAAGMAVSVDGIGNLRGLYGDGRRPRLLVGSHLDTVPNAGAYDGVLGVCLALALVEARQGRPLPFDLEVIGFSEEEGVRFGRPFLGSLALVGRLNSELLALRDKNGWSVEEAIERFGLKPAEMGAMGLDERTFGFLEMHIEQGPVLDGANEALAVVWAIAGQSRWEVTFAGQANHAGTTPMEQRRDALAGAAEWIGHVEQSARATDGLVATVGKIDVQPGAANIIPGRVLMTLDVRHARDEVRRAAVEEVCGHARTVAIHRQLDCEMKELVDQAAVVMDEHLADLLERGMKGASSPPRRMVSGAGHDAMILAEKVPSVMLFIRSIGGISHHPDEAVRVEDVAEAIATGSAFLEEVAGEMTK